MEFENNPALFGERLKKLRQQRRLTMRAVTNELKLHSRAVYEYEVGETTPTYWTLIKLAMFFDVSLDYLVGFSAEPKWRQQTQQPQEQAA